MNNRFAVVLKDRNYIAVTPDESLNLDSYEKKMAFVISELKQAKIGADLIESIRDLDEVKKDPNLEPIKWCNNEFLIFLKNQSYIAIETGSYKPMTLEDKMEFAIGHLKKSGMNPDHFDHIGDQNELKSKTNVMLISWAITAVIVAVIIFTVFKK